MSPNHKEYILPLYHNDTLVLDDIDKANLFNNFFYNQTLINDNNVEIPLLTDITDVIFSSIELSFLEVKHVLDNLSLGKAI